jgi:peroxin-2
MFTAMALPVLDTSSSEETISPYPIHIPYIDGDQGWECLRCCEIVQGADRYSVEVPESDSDLNVSGSEYEFSSDLDMYTDMSGSMGSFSESALSE